MQNGIVRLFRYFIKRGGSFEFAR